MASKEWRSILSRLKSEFRVFLRDVSIRHPSSLTPLLLSGSLAGASTEQPDYVIAGRPSIAGRGNILEAINLASSQFSCDHIDRDLVRTGISTAVITPGTGLFEVDYRLLVTTTDKLVENGIGIDLVCLSRMPLHSVPLFKYKDPRTRHEAQINEQLQSHRDPLDDSPNESSNDKCTLAVSTRAGSVHIDPLRARGTRKQKWCYGVPHWIDVSFWTSASEISRPHSKVLGKLLNGSSISSLNQRRKPFRPRVKMHELQMMGLMEEASDDISVPYMPPLHRASPSSDHTKGFKDVMRLPGRESSLRDNGLPKSLASSQTSSLYSSPRIKPVESSRSKIVKDFMSDYDHLVFKVPGRHHPNRKLRSRGTSNSDYARYLQDVSTGASMSSVGTSREGHERGSLSRRSSAPRQVRQIKNNDPAAKPDVRTTPSKAKRFPRQISFGLRGFGSATPKAIASTEVSAQNAKSESLLGHTVGTATFSSFGIDSTRSQFFFEAMESPLRGFQQCVAAPGTNIGL